MRKVLKILAWIAGACLALVLVIVISLWLMLGDACGNDLIAQLPSPDGKFNAIVFQRDCGATTGYSTQISVLPSDRSLGNSSGNVFSADTDHGAAPSGSGGGPAVQVRWIGPTSLSVSHHPMVRIFLAKPEFGSVHITYKAAE